MGIEKLANKGLSVIGDYNKMISDETKTIVVVGIARGGTSMVVGSLHHMGVFTGLKSVPPVFEDVYLSTAIESNNENDIDTIIDKYNSKYKIWAYKRPLLINNLEKMHLKFRNPIYLFIFKDIGSIATRNNISMNAEIIQNIKSAQNDYQKIIDFLSSTNNINGMILSYEKIMNNKNDFIESLIELLGAKNITKAQIEKAKNFIEPNPANYLDSSRITKAQGRLGGISNRVVYGWAKYVHTATNAIVDIYLNDLLIATVEANEKRADLEEKFGKACAFSYVLPDEIVLKQGDILRAHVQNDIRDLENSYLKIENI